MIGGNNHHTVSHPDTILRKENSSFDYLAPLSEEFMEELLQVIDKKTTPAQETRIIQMEKDNVNYWESSEIIYQTTK